MISPFGRLAFDTELEETDTEFGFIWIHVDGNYLLCTPDDQFKSVPEVVIDTLRAKSTEQPVEELIDEAVEKDAGAAETIREMYERGFLREGAPVERVHPPEDISLWPRVVGVGVLLCLTGVLWVDVLSALAGPIIENPLSYLLGPAIFAIPLILGAVAVHEFGHYYASWRQGVDPSFGASVINGVIPAVVTRTHGGWQLPRNRRMWNTLAGPTCGLVWTLGVFALYYTVLSHPGVAIAGIICFNLQFASLLPIYHGDGYLLMTDFLDEQNLRTRGLADLERRRPTWAAAYAALSYGVVIVAFFVNLVIGYLVGDVLGAAIVLCLTITIYLESRLGMFARLRNTLASLGG